MGPHIIPAYFHAIGMDISPTYPTKNGQSISLKGDKANAKHFKELSELLNWWDNALLRATICELMSQKIKKLWHDRPDQRDGIRRFAARNSDEKASVELTAIVMEAPGLARQAMIERGCDFAPLVWTRPDSRVEDVIQEFIAEKDRKVLAKAVGSAGRKSDGVEKKQSKI